MFTQQHFDKAFAIRNKISAITSEFAEIDTWSPPVQPEEKSA